MIGEEDVINLLKERRAVHVDQKCPQSKFHGRHEINCEW